MAVLLAWCAPEEKVLEQAIATGGSTLTNNGAQGLEYRHLHSVAKLLKHTCVIYNTQHSTHYTTLAVLYQLNATAVNIHI